MGLTKRSRILLAAATLPVLVGLQSTGAAVKYWDTDGAGVGTATPTGTWDTSTPNWTTDVTGATVGTTWSAGDDAVFSADTNATGTFTVTVTGTQTLNSLTVEEGTITQGTGTIDFGAVNGAINVASGATWNNAGAGTGTIAGTGGITKSGAGLLKLGGANSFSGPLSITNGVAEFTADLGLGAAPGAANAAAVTISNGATLRYNNSAAATLNVNRGVTIGTGGGTIEVTQSANTGLSLPASATFTLNGSGLLTKTGPGRFTMNTTSNSFTGKYKVLGGTINVPGDGRFGLAPAAPVADYFLLDGGALRDAVTSGSTWNANRGITLGAGGGTLMQPGAGTASDSLTYNGIIAGTLGGGLTIAATDAAGGGTTDGIVILGGANTYNGSTTVNTGMTLRLGASNVIPDVSAVALTGTLDLNGVTDTIGALTGGGGTTLGGGTLRVSGNANVTPPNYTGVISGTGNVVKTGPGTQEFAGTNSFVGQLFVEDGILRLRSNNNRVPVGTLVTIGAASTQGKLLLGVTTNSRDQEVSGLVSAGLGGFVGNGASTVATQFATLTINNPVDRAFAGVLGGTGTNENNLNLVKQGVGVQTLSGANTYVGQTTVLAGTLRVEGGSLANSKISVNTGGAFDGGVAGGDLTYNIANDTADLINLTGTGTFDISDFDLLVALSGTQTLGEYIVANAIVGSANILGTAFKTETLPAGWSIDYDGTATNPTSIVLVAVPEPATAGLVLIAGAALALRRRRRA